MISIDVRAETSKAIADINKLGQFLSDKQISRAVTRAINETLMPGRTEARKAVKQVFTIAQRALDGRIDIDKATTYHKGGRAVKDTFLTGAIIANSQPVPMEFFNTSFSYSGGSSTTISKRGIQKTKLKSRAANFGGGIMIEAQKGKKENIPFAFFLPTMTGKVFARGKYRPGNGSWGFVQRHTHLNSNTGNDAVKPLTSVTVHAAAINSKVQSAMISRIQNTYSSNVERHLQLIIAGILK